MAAALSESDEQYLQHFQELRQVIAKEFEKLKSKIKLTSEFDQDGHYFLTITTELDYLGYKIKCETEEFIRKNFTPKHYNSTGEKYIKKLESLLELQGLAMKIENHITTRMD